MIGGKNTNPNTNQDPGTETLRTDSNMIFVLAQRGYWASPSACIDSDVFIFPLSLFLSFQTRENRLIWPIPEVITRELSLLKHQLKHLKR